MILEFQVEKYDMFYFKAKAIVHTKFIANESVLLAWKNIIIFVKVVRRMNTLVM